MTIPSRAAAFAAAFTLVAASHLDAQSSTVRVTIAGGPHAGTYEKTDSCELKDTFPSMFMMAYTVGAMEPKNPLGKTATFRGQTADGVRMEGSVDCRNDSSAGS